MTTPKKLDAVSVLNWDHLCKIAEPLDDDLKAYTSEQAQKAFAYGFISTADDEIRNSMLVSILKNACTGMSAETNEEFVARLTTLFQCDLQLLRQFAKENGIKLKRGQ